MPANRAMKILVADDDRISRLLMQRTLQRYGYEVITAADGRQAAYELSLSDGPRLALINWMMPELDGPELCRTIRRRNDERYVYIILLTAKELHEDIVAGLEAGADDYLVKPCRPAELKARLHTGRRILLLEDKLVTAREEMRFKATHDPLTSLLDRGAILSMLHSELNRPGRESVPLSLLLCDVDHFKNINDVYGHPAGDEVLREVSRRFIRALRSTDAVGRYGGEEFLIVLPGCSNDHLHRLAEQVLHAVRSNPIDTGYGAISVCVSMGALTIEAWDASADLEQLIHQADQALYEAKRNGRDTVIYAESLKSISVPEINSLAGEVVVH